MNITEGLLFPEDRERQHLAIEREKRARIYGTSEFWAAYDAYIRSARWRKLRSAIIDRTKRFCEHCARYCPKRFEVHHKTYERFTKELLSDLEGLCISWHVETHRKRARENRARYEQYCSDRLAEARREGLLTIRYGEDYVDRFSELEIERMERDADEWISRKDEEDEY